VSGACAAKWRNHFDYDKKILDAKVVVRGTRLAVDVIPGLRADGSTPAAMAVKRLLETPKKSRFMRLRKFGAIIGIALVVGLGLDVIAGWMLVRPHRENVGDAPADLHATRATISTPQGLSLVGWFVRGEPGAGAVLLLHGLHADRRQMVPVARMLANERFTLLLFDFEAEGESDGDRISVGFRESDDARAALEFLRREAPGEKVGAIGRSMGGAAALLGRGPLDVDALVFESVYPDIEQAVAERIGAHLGRVAGGVGRALGRPLAPLLLWQLRPWLAIGCEDLRPVAAIARLRAPLLLISGDQDRYLPVDEARRLFDAAPGPKELWIIAGAVHDRMADAVPAEYEKRVVGFLRCRLR
jgi:pimeloyl-ACP methyl ester carboxylesterase